MLVTEDEDCLIGGPRASNTSKGGGKMTHGLHTQSMAASEEAHVGKKDKKLVFLSSSVLQKVKERPMVTGTQIANEILEMYRNFCEVST
jgi:hypothetical protein